MHKIRIDRFFSELDIFSRTEIKKVIKQGRIRIGDSIVSLPTTKVDTENDIVFLDDVIIEYTPYIYIMLNKPKGVVSATENSNDVTVIDILPENLKRKGLFPAGRLDKDTTGFVLITNDGVFAHNILSPANHVSKTYIVTLASPIDDIAISGIENGITLSDGTMCRPAKLKKLNDQGTICEIIITEGKYHQIKRMFGATKNKVVDLKRVKIGDLELDENLAEGECKVILYKQIEEILCK